MALSLQDRVASAICAIRDVEERPSQFAPRPAFWIDGREFAHLEGDGIEIRLTRKGISAQRARLKADPRVTLRSGDWLSIRLTSARDIPFVVEIAERAVDANRAGPGERRRDPTERDLARRRRAHGASTEDLAR